MCVGLCMQFHTPPHPPTAKPIWPSPHPREERRSCCLGFAVQDISCFSSGTAPALPQLSELLRADGWALQPTPPTQLRWKPTSLHQKPRWGRAGSSLGGLRCSQQESVSSSSRGLDGSGVAPGSSAHTKCGTGILSPIPTGQEPGA